MTADAVNTDNPTAQASTDDDRERSAIAALSVEEKVLLLTGADWYEYSTKNYTGWPSADNPYMNPTPNSPYILETVLHLTPAT